MPPDVALPLQRNRVLAPALVGKLGEFVGVVRKGEEHVFVGVIAAQELVEQHQEVLLDASDRGLQVEAVHADAHQRLPAAASSAVNRSGISSMSCRSW